MRILFINDHKILGGKEKYLASTRRALRDAGHVTALIHSVRPNRKAIEDDEISFCIPGIDTYRETRSTLDRLRECIGLFKPDVIHINHNVANLVVVSWLLRHFPSLRSVHDVEFLCPTRHFVRKNTNAQCDARCGRICFSSSCLSITSPSGWYRLVRTRTAQWMYSRWSKLNTQSEYVRKNLREVIGRQKAVSMFPVFIEGTADMQAMARSGAHFVFVGRLNSWKGPQLAIEALARLPDRATLEIIGTGNQEPELRILVRSLNLESRVKFAGFLEGKELSSRFLEANAVVLPSIVPENCPMSIQEAMATGRAVISTTVGGIPDLVKDGVSGLLVPPNDVRALARAMQLLIDDPQLCQTLGSNGRQEIGKQQYQRDYHIQQLLEEYDSRIRHFTKRQ